MMRIPRLLQYLAALLVVGSVVVVLWSAISTSSARVNATTSGASFFSAGVIDLAQPDSVVDLLFDADGLHPGMDVSGCVEVEYRGSIPASVRLHASLLGGTGLERYIDLRIVALDGDTCAEAASLSAGTGAEMVGEQIFVGRLSALWAQHPDYQRAIVLDPEMVSSDRLVIQAAASVVDDNGAMGRTTDFALTLEARP